ADLLDALGAGGDLGAQVGQVGLRVAGRVRGGGEQLPGLLLPEAAVAHQQPVVEQHPLLVHVAAVRRHRAGGDATDLRVVAAGRDVEQDLADGVIVHRGDDSDVGRVRPAV